jgi:hypothetical protein
VKRYSSRRRVVGIGGWKKSQTPKLQTPNKAQPQNVIRFFDISLAFGPLGFVV